MINCQNGLKSLETLQKWSRMPSFMKKIIFSQSNSFLEFSKFHLWSSVRIWFGIWGNPGWNMVNCQNGLKSLETLQKWSVYLLSWKKSFLASQTHFWSFQNFTYGLVSESMIWYLGKSGVKYGKLSKWLEITWNFAKMIAYAFFHEKNHF